MAQLPTTKMYALVHGVTGRIWERPGGRWLFHTVESMKLSWDIYKEAGLVNSEFEDHRVVELDIQIRRSTY